MSSPLTDSQGRLHWQNDMWTETWSEVKADEVRSNDGRRAVQVKEASVWPLTYSERDGTLWAGVRRSDFVFKGSLWLLWGEEILGRKGGSRRPSRSRPLQSSTQGSQWRGLECQQQTSQRRSHSKYTQNVETTGFTDGLNTGCETRKELRTTLVLPWLNEIV